MNNKFLVEICSDLDYEEMVADISYEHHRIATVTQENGIDKMEIEIIASHGNTKSFLPFDDFIDALLFAKKRLIEMQKLPEE